MSVQTAAPELEHEVLAPRSWKTPVLLTVVSVFAIWMCLSLPAGAVSKVSVDTGNRWLKVIPLSLPSFTAVAVLTILMVACTAAAWWSAVTRTVKVGRIRLSLWIGVGYGTFFVAAFLLWAVAGRGALQLTALLFGSLFLSVPLVFGAMSGTVCERVGVINVAIEGQLLGGAFLAAVIGSATGNPWIGLLAAPVAGALIGALLALFAVRYWVDNIIVSVVLNVLVTGLTSYLFSTVMTNNKDLLMTPVRLPTWRIPVLSEIPVVGPVLFAQNALVYIMYAGVVVLQIMLFRSRWGLRLRACGEHPRAADTVGIKVNLTRVVNTIIGGAIAGLGGAFFTVANGLAFGKSMSAGRGYIALAAMILGGWKPKGAIVAALLFGFADNLQNSLGVVGVQVPSQFMLMAPYLVTIFAVAGLVGRVRPPAMEGKPYKG